MENSGNTLLTLIIVGLILFFAFKIYNKFKVPKVGALCLVNGGVKTGKTTFAVYLAWVQIKRRLLVYKIRKGFRTITKFIKRKRELEEPKLYSNIPLNFGKIKAHKITKEHLLRQKRFDYGSVILISEMSLVADSQMIKDQNINLNLLELFKLIGHETHGGIMIVDTQSILDVHYSLKRSIDRHLYIHSCFKYLPFFMLMRVREERYAEDGTVVNAYNEDLEESLKPVLVPKRIWKKFDAYCYSAMTDDLPKENLEWKNKSNLKINDYVSFRDTSHRSKVIVEIKQKYNLPGGNKNEKEKPKRIA